MTSKTAAAGAILLFAATFGSTETAAAPVASATESSRLVAGTAVAVDGATLQIGGRGESGFRLFGTLPPASDSTLSHLARGALDDLLIGHTVGCSVLDEDRYGPEVVRCGTAATPDIALALLRQGWLLADGPALQNSTLAQAYLAAEYGARQGGAGVWARSIGTNGVSWSAWTLLAAALGAGGAGWWMARSMRIAMQESLLALNAGNDRRHERERALTAMALRKVLLADVKILGQECGRLCGSTAKLAEGQSRVRAMDLQQLVPPQPAAYPSVAEFLALLDADLATKMVRFYDELNLTHQQLRRWDGAAPNEVVPALDVQNIQCHWDRVCKAATECLRALSNGAYSLEPGSHGSELAGVATATRESPARSAVSACGQNAA